MTMLEVACFDPEGAIVAGKAGADRIELCDDQSNGGVSPPREWLRTVKAQVSIPVFVMIRPRGGDFRYSPEEFDQMRADLDAFKQDGADGFVLGILDQDHGVDVVRTTELVRRAHPLPCTFHRAFDDTRNPLDALEDVAKTGCRSILTSGGAPSAIHGTHVIQSLVEKARGQMDIIPGGGVRSSNLARIRKATGATVFHSSAVLNGSAVPDTAEIHRMKTHLEQTGVALDRAGGLSRTTSCSASETAEDDTLSHSAVSVGQWGTTSQ